MTLGRQKRGFNVTHCSTRDCPRLEAYLESMGTEKRSLPHAWALFESMGAESSTIVPQTAPIKGETKTSPEQHML